MNTISVLGKAYRNEDLDSEEEVKYLDREVVSFQPKGRGSIQDN